MAEVLPLMYLHGMSTGDFAPALSEFFGSGAGLSRVGDHPADDPVAGRAAGLRRRGAWRTATTCTCGSTACTSTCASKRTACAAWSIVGVRADGTKELVAIADGLPGVDRVLGRPAARPANGAGCAPRCSRSVTARWGSGRRCATCSPRPANSGAGCTRSPTSSTRCRSRPSPRAKRLLAEIRDAEDRDHAEAAATAFAAEFGAKWPKAVAKITDDLEPLLAFYDFPAEHWIHLKTTNPIESTFATVRLRTKVTKGPGSRAAGLAMAFKLIESAQHRWRAVNGPHLVALVRAGATLREGGARRTTNTRIRKPPRDQRKSPIHRS